MKSRDMKNLTRRNWTRKHTLIIGLALILMTNAVALLGVYWNRAGEPESQLALTQRELQQNYGWGMYHENSGVTLRIVWRVPTEQRSWNVNPPKEMQSNFRWASRQLSREVLLVLELDGPAFQKSLQQAQQFADEQDAKLAARPNDKSLQQIAKAAHDQARMEEDSNSRLFAVDAGLDLDDLREQYPDRNRYAIVRAQVRPSYLSGLDKFTGNIDKLSIDEINVPYEFHSAFDTRVGPATTGQKSGNWTFEVDFGQRLEPWITGITVGEQNSQEPIAFMDNGVKVGEQ
jgi:hypothetical protein